MTESQMNTLQKGLELVTGSVLKKAELDLGDLEATVYRLNAKTVRIDLIWKDSIRD